MKALSFYFRSKKRELKNLVSINSFGSLKMGYRFSIFVQEIVIAKLWEHGYYDPLPLPNLMFLPYTQPEIWEAGENDLPLRSTEFNIRVFFVCLFF